MGATTIAIKGMHCKSCELLIEDELMKIHGVQKIDISHKTGTATITFQGKNIAHKDIVEAVHEAGYTLGTNDGVPFFSHNGADYIQVGFATIILLLLVFIARELGLFDLNVAVTNNFSSLPLVLLVGLTAGVSTCMALVGGLVLAVAGKYGQDHPSATTQEKFIPHLFFNFGRLISFFILGGAVGLIGSAFQPSPQITGILILLVGTVMMVLGLQLTRIFPRLTSMSITLPKGVSRALGISTQAQSSYSHTRAMLLGALTFFVPCGFTQAIQLYAMTTGSFITGALTMAVFALGTMPGLLSLGGLASVIKSKSSGFFFTMVGLIVIAMALFTIRNGLALAGVNMSKSTQSATAQDPNVTIENGVQVVHMEQNVTGYTPNTFTLKKNMPVKWFIKSVYPSCASSLVVQQLNIRALLNNTEQEFDFTPRKTGEIPFNCSMGMYSGAITVTN